MKVPLEKIVIANDALGWLSEVSELDHLNATAKYDVSFLLGAIQPHLRAYEAARLAAVKRYGEEGENGLEVPPKSLAAFGQEMQELLRVTQCDLPDTVIPAAPLMAIITPAQLFQLDWLLEIDHEQPEADSSDKKPDRGSAK